MAFYTCDIIGTLISELIVLYRLYKLLCDSQTRQPVTRTKKIATVKNSAMYFIDNFKPYSFY